MNFWGGIAGWLLAIIGLVTSLHFYEASKVKPALTFSVDPLKTELQRPNQDRDLGFTYAGKPVDSESITSVQVSIWNAGTRSIRDNDVLDPLRLVMPNGSTILRARVKKATRPICSFECLDAPEDYKSGMCRLRWKILEPGDGAVVQVIYAGNAHSDPKLEGIIEGQSEGIVVKKYDLDKDRTSIVKQWEPSTVRLIAIGLLLFFAVLTAFIVEKMNPRSEATKKMAAAELDMKRQLAELRRNSTRRLSALDVGLVVFAVLLCVVALLLLFTGHSKGPPFGW